MRFDGWIAGVGTARGVRIVLGHWISSPFGAFSDVMVEEADGERTLFAPTRATGEFIAATYRFDRLRIVPVTVAVSGRGAGAVWTVAAGPLEQAVTNKAYGWNPDEKQEMSVGFGSYERTIDALDQWFAGHHFVCGERFTMADVYVGSAVDWGLAFKSIPERASFAAYAERFRARDAYREAKAIDNKLIEEMRANG